MSTYLEEMMIRIDLEEMMIRIDLEAVRRELTAILGYRPW